MIFCIYKQYIEKKIIKRKIQVLKLAFSTIYFDLDLLEHNGNQLPGS